MAECAQLAAYLLSTMGLTVLIVWPERGPGAWLRDRLLKRVLGERLAEALDCYICCGFWCGLALSPAWWLLYRQAWIWTGGLMVSFLFWLMRDRV
jgi:hypothetical protein